MANVLVVEDNEVISQMITLVLELEGYDVTAVTDGQLLDSALEQAWPDVILMDIMLGDLDGRTLCNKLKNSDATATIPVIMMSAADDLQLSTSYSCKPDDFLSKPFPIDCLINKVKSQLVINNPGLS